MARNAQKSRSAPKPADSKAGAARATKRNKSKKEVCLALLRRPKGASLAELQEALGWQAHSVRGFLSGTIKKRPGIDLRSEAVEGRPRRYRIIELRTEA